MSHHHLSDRELLELLIDLCAEIDARVKKIECILRLDRQCITHFTIQETHMQPIAPGFSPQFTATPQPAGNVLNPAQPVPTWTSSDTTNAPVSVDKTGLVATVAIPSGATVGASFTLTVNYTNADGTTATGSAGFTIAAAPPVDISSFTIEQSA